MRALQELLGITEGGDFGPATERAVKAYQKCKGMEEASNVDDPVSVSIYAYALK